MTTAATLARRAALAPMLVLALLAGCSDHELYSQLSERQANEMVAVLRSAGIEAEKKAHEGKFSVLTSKGDFSQAVRTLNAQGYPRENFDSMGKVFKREGFVSSPLEERARLMHAMSQEISNTIANIDGVVTARVHLVVPERNPLLDKPQPAAAAVFIKHRPERNLSGQISQIKALVVNSIEGLSYDNVTVALFPAEGMPSDPSAAPSPKAAPAAADASQAGRASLALPLLGGGAAGALALGGGGLLWWPCAAPGPGDECPRRRVDRTTPDAGARRAAPLRGDTMSTTPHSGPVDAGSSASMAGTAPQGSISGDEARERRHQRAAIARRLRQRAPDAVNTLDWDALDAAPTWLALPEDELNRFECQVGAMLCAPSLRLWIDGARLNAARSAVGAPFLQALRALPSTQILPHNVAPSPRIDHAEQVAPSLRAAGASVLLASMLPGPLRLVVGAALAPATPAQMAGPLAQSLIARTLTLRGHAP